MREMHVGADLTIQTSRSARVVSGERRVGSVGGGISGAQMRAQVLSAKDAGTKWTFCWSIDLQQRSLIAFLSKHKDSWRF